MDKTKTKNFGEINLKKLFKQIYDRKFSFAASLFLCLALAYGYVKIAAPTYEISSSVLIDASGKNRQLGESRYVDGGVGAIESDKNLYNEMAILKSFSLIEQALKDVNFEVSYFSKSVLVYKEHYGYFPLEVVVLSDKPQIFDEKFQVELLGGDKFKLSIDTEKFNVSNPENNTTHEVENHLDFSKTYSFDQEINHDYFNFKIKKPSYKVNAIDFEGKDLFFQINSLSGLTNHYQNLLKVSQVDIQASILNLNVTGPSAAKEIDFMNALLNAFINRKLFEREEIAAGKENFIRDQLESISDSLSRASQKLENFKQGASAVDLTRSAANALDQLQTLETDRGQIALNIKYYQSVLQYINDNSAIDKIVAPSMVGINDPILNDNLVELKRLHSEKTRLEFYKGAKSYDLVLIAEQIANTTNSVKENIQNLISAADLQLKDRNQRIARLESTINQLPVNEKNLLNFERENTLYGNMYNYLNQELAKTEIARADDISDTKVLDKPRQVGDGPVAPQKLLIMVLAFIIGFLIPLVGIIFSDNSLESIQQITQIEQYSNIPVLTQVGTFNNSLSTLANYKSDLEKEETFRNLSANLQYMVPDQENNVISITSVLQGEGKTFCALNLAVNYARAGKKTLLLDLNFRNPVLARGLDIQDTVDLKAYIADATYSVEKVTQQHQHIPNLYYIFTKTPESNPHQYLSNSRLQTLITALKYEYDYIIIDTPAVGLVSDYLLIARHTDINLFIARRGVARISHLDELERLIQKGQMKNSFIVFNGSSKKANPAKHYAVTGEAQAKGRLLKWPLGFRKSVS
jgi:tyrosine-protein kinase Etk/Wzc